MEECNTIMELIENIVESSELIDSEKEEQLLKIRDYIDKMLLTMSVVEDDIEKELNNELDEDSIDIEGNIDE